MAAWNCKKTWDISIITNKSNKSLLTEQQQQIKYTEIEKNVKYDKWLTKTQTNLEPKQNNSTKVFLLNNNNNPHLPLTMPLRGW